jgi:hypothetical protein
VTTRRTLILTSLALTLFAGSLRFYHLGAWPFFGDELATFREADAFAAEVPDDTQTGRLARLIPLSYVVHRAGYAVFGRDEFGSRAILALLGTAQVVVVFLGLVGPLGRPAALATALLLAAWPEHIYQSQQHRFYMIAAFLASLCMLAGARAVERRSMAWTVAACAAALATVLAHTIQGLALGGLFAGILLAARVRRQPLPRAQLCVVLGTAILAAGFLGLALLSLGRGWNAGQGWGASPIASLLAAVYEVGWPVILLAGLGAVLALRQADGAGAYWLAWAGLWVAAGLVLPLLVVYHAAYLFPLSLGVMVLAGYAAGHIHGCLRSQGRWSTAAWLGVVTVLNLPSLLSHYSDGSRHDYRTAARYIERHCEPGDQVAAVAPGSLRHYSPACGEAVSLQTWDPLPDLKKLSVDSGRLWIVLPSYRPGKSEELRQWLTAHCTQKLELRPRRFDYREHLVEVYLYAPTPVGIAAAGR